LAPASLWHRNPSSRVPVHEYAQLA
jgi:hypothetical protein